MLDLIELITIWLGAPCRRLLRTLTQRTTELFTPPAPNVWQVLPTMPAYARRPRPLPPFAHGTRDELIGSHETPFVARYVTEHERQALIGPREWA